MEFRVHSFDEELLIAEHAAEWLLRARHADAREKERLLDWLSRSPQNSGELLAATSMDLAMRQVFRNRRERIDVDELLATSVNVLSMRDRVAPPPPAAGPGRRTRLFAAASLGVAAATVAIVVTPTPVRSWLYQCEYIAPVSEQRVVELSEGSAIAINAGSGVLVLFAANARDVYADGGRAMFAATQEPTRPYRVRVVASPGQDSSSGKGAILDALGGNSDVFRRLDRVIQSTGAIAPPMTINLPAMNPWDKPIIVERHGNDILIR